MSSNDPKTPTGQAMTGDDNTGDASLAPNGIIPVSPARYAELQQNGLYGLAPERAVMRVDLPHSPYDLIFAQIEDDPTLRCKIDANRGCFYWPKGREQYRSKQIIISSAY